MRAIRIAAIFTISSCTMSSATLAETVTYTYDAKGRLIKVVRSGSANNGVTTDMSHDKANNRTRLKVSGASR